MIGMVFFTPFLFAHSPDLSSMMIYEQNGKYFLAIKSSLTAFEGEIDYHFNKNAYKTPEEFQQLVSKHFQKNCLLIINNYTIKFIHPTVVLGHETTVFAELLNVPDKFNSLYIRNTVFKDMPNNMCELILTLKGLPQKQYILTNENNQEVKLNVENDHWEVEETNTSFFKSSNLLLWSLLFLSVLVVVAIALWRKKNIS
jgi:hypothetical protein